MLALAEELRAMPGVHGVGIAAWAIFEGSSWTDQVIVPGKGPSEREEIFYRVSPGYFGALRTPLLYGRDFEPTDQPDGDSIPAIVNLAFARQYLDGEHAVGKVFQRMEGKKRVSQRVVGVVANAHYGSLRQGAEPIVYLPIEGQTFFALYVRSELGVGSVLHQAENAAKRAGPGLRVRDVTALNTLVGNTILKEKLLADIGGTFAVLGVMLASIGLFGLLNYSVVRRKREIGIRAALGAQRVELVGLVMKDLAGMIGAGLIAGLAGSLAILLALKSLLFGLKTADPLVLATAIAVFVLAGIVAAGVPAGRAASVDPMVALRQE
ncbi:MAG: ABC transporter permease [Acidobacteriaceae bacterium]|nr:ABC transporter permease [Acidobacteriaceae bacterium]